MACVVPFSEVLDGATVRFTNIDGKHYLSVRDFIMVVCDKSNKRASETWITTINQLQKQELAEFIKQFQFSGKTLCKGSLLLVSETGPTFWESRKGGLYHSGVLGIVNVNTILTFRSYVL